MTLYLYPMLYFPGYSQRFWFALSQSHHHVIRHAWRYQRGNQNL